MACGCSRRCTSQQFYNRKVIKHARLLFWNLEKLERSNWMSEKFSDFQSPSRQNGTCSFRISGNNVCRNAWLQAYGISKSSFYRYKTRWLNQSLYGRRKKSLGLKEQKQNAIHWFGEYATKRGERPPHQQEIWLPFGLRKKEIYQAYKNEQIIEFKNFVSCTSFFSVWKKYYSHVKIRSVSKNIHIMLFIEAICLIN